MKNRIILVLILAIFCSRIIAQPHETIYQGTVVQAGYVDDASLGPFNIGFNFTYFGNTYSQFYVSSNGLVLFTSDPTNISGAEVAIPDAAAPNNFIAAFWDDLVVDGTGKILYKTIGAAPNRKLVIQFTNMGFYGAPAFMGTFEVILYETSNIIQVQYRLIVDNTSTRARGESATIGIENSNGTAGVQYAYHNPAAVITGKALSYTPSGAAYTLNTDAMYEGIYLTSNIILPEPGIPILISPPQNSVIGSDYNFSWSDGGNSASYSLLISTSSDLGGATYYPAGSSTSFNVTGLTIGSTYYWGVFATNATGTTWCEIKKFTTSSTAPLAPVPQSIWTEQLQDKTITLFFTGGNASPKTAVITSLPSQGQLYQYYAGARASRISSVPAIVTDAGRNIIYAASGGTGNGVGNFNFKLNDTGGDSPDGTITINVTPPGIPEVLLVAKTTNVEIQFDIPMADPSGKQNQFTVTVNGTPATISASVLKTGDPTTIVLTLATPLAGTETVSVSYFQGDVTGSTGGILSSFTNQTVTLTGQTIAFPSIPLKFVGNPPFNPGATASSSLPITYSSSNLPVATSTGSTITILSAGTSEIKARQAGNGIYAPAIFTQTLSVENAVKTDQTITFGSLPAKINGDPDFFLSASASSGLPVLYSSNNPSVATITGNLVHIAGTGSVIITASQPGNTIYNPATNVQQTLTVNNPNQTITFGVLPVKTYGDPDFTLTATASSGLTVIFSSNNNSVATVTGNLVHLTGSGTAVITASQPGNLIWDAALDVMQTLTVNGAAQTITFGALPVKTYGDLDFTLTATASSGLSVSYTGDNPAVATITGNQIHINGAGTAVITATQAGNLFYIPAVSVPQTLTVNQAALTFTADNKSKDYLAPVPVLTYSITGFVNGEDQSVLDALPSIQTIAVQNSPAGNYPITISGGSDNNYSYTYVLGTLVVNKISQTITFTSVPEKLLVKDTYTLSATSTSGLSVLFESGDISIATVTGDQLTGVSKGTVQIRAYNSGDQNYTSAEVFASVEIYSTHKNIMYLFTPNNDGFNDYWELPDLAAWGKCDVKVYSRLGKMVFSDPDYNNLWDGRSNGNPLPEGPYYFIIKTENAGTVTGTVNLVR